MTEARRLVIGILAGGAGRRAGGADKGWLLRDGRPQIEVLVDSIRACERRLGLQPSRLLISANRHIDDYARFTDEVIPDGHEFGDYPGPLIGVMRLLQSVNADAVLITIPVDVLPNSAFEAAMFALCGAHLSPPAIIRDVVGLQPMFACYPALLAANCQQAIRSGERSVKAWQEQLAAQQLQITERLGNANSRDDYDIST